jgi:hypothetical protein
MDSKG